MSVSISMNHYKPTEKFVKNPTVNQTEPILESIVLGHVHVSSQPHKFGKPVYCLLRAIEARHRFKNIQNLFNSKLHCKYNITLTLSERHCQRDIVDSNKKLKYLVISFI